MKSPSTSWFIYYMKSPIETSYVTNFSGNFTIEFLKILYKLYNEDKDYESKY